MKITKRMHLTDSQMGLYLDCLDNDKTIKYNITFEYIFPDETDAVKLTEACNSVIRNYPVLSAGVVNESGFPELVLTDSSANCNYLELTEDQYNTLKKDEAAPFNFDGSVLSRWNVVKTDNHICLYFVIHHIIFDGISSVLIQHAIEDAYLGKDLIPEAVNIFDLEKIDSEAVSDSKKAEAVDYFKNLLGSNAVNSNLTADKSGADFTICNTIFLNMGVSLDEIKEFSRKCGVTENVILLSAFAYSLSVYENRDDALFTSISSGRRGRDIDNTIGFFVRTFPLYFKCNKNSSVKDFISSVKENYFATMGYDYLSFSDFADHFKIRSDIKYVYQGSLDNDFIFNGKKVKRVLKEVTEALSNLDLMIKKTEEGFIARFDYRDALYSEENIRSFAALYFHTVMQFLKVENLCDISYITDDGINLVDECRKFKAVTSSEILKEDVHKTPVLSKKAPSNDIQRRILNRVADVIVQSDIGVDDDLFSCGLSSLGLIKLNMGLAEEFKTSLSIKDIRSNSTIEKLEKLIHLKSDSKKDLSSDYPLTKNQEGIYTECISNEGSTNYNVPLLLKSSVKLNTSKLKGAIVKAVNAHSYLLTELYISSDGIVRQRRSENEYNVSEIDEIFSDNFDSLKNELMKPFDIVGGRLLRISVIHGSVTGLFIDVHHIIADGTSVNILLDDISRAYNGEDVEAETFTGYDVALLEEHMRTESELKSAKAHYDKIFAGVDTDFLPGKDLYPDSLHDSGSFEILSKTDIVESASKFCLDNSVGMNALMLSVFGYVLAKFNAESHSVFTTVYNGRTDSRTERTFAMLVKTLPVYVNAEDKAPSLLVKELSDQILDSMINDTYSFAEISREYGIRTDIMFIYQGQDFAHTSFCGESVEEIPIELTDKKAPISLQVFVDGNKLLYKADYDNNSYSEKLIRSLIDAFDTALKGFLSCSSLKDVSLVSDEMLKVMDEYNITDYPYDETLTMCSWFERTCKEHPDQTAVVCWRRKYTYSAIEKLTASLASYLNSKGIGSGDFVPMLVDRNEYMVIGTYGVLRSGAAYEPLDPTYPEDRLHYMIKDSGAKFIIADRHLSHIAEKTGLEILYTDEIVDLPEAPGYTSKVKPDDNFIIIYTSGTTGVPKGNVLSHRQPVALFDFHIRDAKLDENSHSAHFTGFSFDAGMLDLHASLVSGGTLYIIPEDLRLDLKAMDNYYCDNAITHTSMTTQMANLFLNMTNCKSLKYVNAGGEKLVPFIPPEWVRFINGYGPCECIVYTSGYDVYNDAKLQPIGKPHSNLKYYIIDSNGLRLPFGAAGELCIAGKQVGKGYLGLPEKTAEVFTANPFTDEKGYERIYHTGDIVRELTDGNYDFVGRKDSQVKISGFRVELPEIEQVIRKYKGIENATVQAFDDSKGVKYIAAYVVSDENVDFNDLSDFILQTKPSYMVPSAFMQLDSIPLTANGKVNKKALPSPTKKAKTGSTEPMDAIEKSFCDIFCQVLGLENVGADDDFFAIGGTSIAAAQAVVKCDAAGYSIVYKNFFENPTPRKLARFVNGGKSNNILAPSGKEKEKFDYSCLEYNVPENLNKIKFNDLGTVLLTGTTGFLGSHVYRTLMEKTDSNVICLIRNKSGFPASDRFNMMMVYYFEDWFIDDYAKRTIIIDGDLSDEDLDDKLGNLKFDVIFNCAANVKHFAPGNSLAKDNFESVERLIKVAEKHNARIIQASSLSVCGESVNGSIPMDFRFKENNLNIGQSLENKYVYSKYLAEQAIIDAISRGRIKGKIIRFGNLAARDSDGEYQINASNSGLLRIMQGYIKLGCYPVDSLDAKIEFSPIDKAAEAMVLLAGTPDEFTVFHAKNCHEVHYAYFINALKDCGNQIDIVEREEFEERLKKAMDTADDITDFTGFIAYLDNAESSVTDLMVYNDDESNSKEAGKEKKYEVHIRVSSDATYTTKALYRLGFAWPLTSMTYLDAVVKALDDKAFFGI